MPSHGLTTSVREKGGRTQQAECTGGLGGFDSAHGERESLKAGIVGETG